MGLPAILRRRAALWADELGAVYREQHTLAVLSDGRELELEFDHDPTDDEILAALPPKTPLRPSTLAERVEAVAELAQAREALLAAAADTVAFTAQERTKLTTGAGLVANRIKDLLA